MAAAAARIRLYGAACLRRRARPVPAGKGGPLLDALWTALDAADGVGLAAPQIGDLRRALVAREPGGRGRRLELVNPELVATFGPPERFREGCLSFPGLYVDVVRSRGAVVRYEDRDGRPAELRDEGLVARIVQHELDHLDGVLFVDRLPAARRLLAGPRLLWLRLRGGRAGKGE